MNGILKVTIAMICVVNNNSEDMMLYVMCFGLMISAMTKIAMALKKTAIIYIQ